MCASILFPARSSGEDKEDRGAAMYFLNMSKMQNTQEIRSRGEEAEGATVCTSVTFRFSKSEFHGGRSPCCSMFFLQVCTSSSSSSSIPLCFPWSEIGEGEPDRGGRTRSPITGGEPDRVFPGGLLLRENQKDTKIGSGGKEKTTFSWDTEKENRTKQNPDKKTVGSHVSVARQLGCSHWSKKSTATQLENQSIAK